MWTVCTSKLLTISLLTDNSPLMHHEPSHGDEKCSSSRASYHQDTDPSDDLEEVVWACNPVESESLWNSPGSGAGWAEVRQNDMSVQVGELAVDIGRETGPDQVLRACGKGLHWRSSQRVWCEDPV